MTMNCSILRRRRADSLQKLFETHDERKGFLRRTLPSRRRVTDGSFYRSGFTQESLFQFQSEAIRKEAQQGSCVFVGRCADYVLRISPNVVGVFITASMEFRIRNVINKLGLLHDEARKLIQQSESSRRAVLQLLHGQEVGAAQSYDLCIDSPVSWASSRPRGIQLIRP